MSLHLALLVVAAFLAVADSALVPVATTSTVTQLTTSFYTTPTTTTILTASVCGSLAAGVNTFCRRKRESWLDLPILMGQDPDIDAYLRQQYQPSPVLKVQPTDAAYFRDGDDKHQGVESSFGPVDPSSVVASGKLFSSAVSVKTSLASTASSILNQLINPPKTVISTVSAYTSTSTVSVYTTTKTFIISSCIPPNLPYTAC